MIFKTFCIIVIFMFVTATQRAFVHGRLEGEGIRGYCETNDTFIKRDNNFARRIQQTFRNNVHKINMECEGNTTVSPGVIVKDLKTTLSDDSTREHCTFKIQAPEDYRVYVYSYSYQWISVDYDSCVSNPPLAAGLTGFYDGKIDKKSLLYRSSFSNDITAAISTGRELMIDVHLDSERARLYKRQRVTIRYAFIKKNNEKIIVYGENKS